MRRQLQGHGHQEAPRHSAVKLDCGVAAEKSRSLLALLDRCVGVPYLFSPFIICCFACKSIEQITSIRLRVCIILWALGDNC